MLQIIQDLKNGETMLVESSIPTPGRGMVLIKSHFSLVSPGTERMLVEFGKKNLIQKALDQPERVKQVISKLKTDGFAPTYEAVMRKLDTPIALGYCNAGEVVGVGEEVTEFRIGDRVISNGPHAEFVCIPKNLVAKIPGDLTYEEASFTIIASIALQGIRLVNPGFGETVVVIGLGLIGLITVQLLVSNGCKVIAFDLDENRVSMAKNYGAHAFLSEDSINDELKVKQLSDGYGADAVIITASSASQEIIHLAAQMSRKRGRIILVGVVGLHIQRADFYEKELSFQVSCSYGPGRYDEVYEQKGHDYPLPFVRWTEKRNFEAILQALTYNKLEVKSLIGKIVELEQFESIYQNIGDHKDITYLIHYDVKKVVEKSRNPFDEKKFPSTQGRIGIIGAGNFTSSTVLPILTKLNAPVQAICGNKGLAAGQLARQYKIPYTASSFVEILQDEQINSVVITTRHSSHAAMVQAGLNAGKHVFIEKPLALNLSELNEISKAFETTAGSLTVGFNRRFAPMIQELKKELSNCEAPIQIVATMNAGSLPMDHWTNASEHGGRIIGEACHYFDLVAFLCNSTICEVYMQSLGLNAGLDTDHASILVHLKNGSSAVINYFTNGSKDYPKERIEVHQLNRTAIIDNFKRIDYYGYKKRSKSANQDKGHHTQFKTWLNFITQGGHSPIPFESLWNTTYATLMAIESFKEKKVISF
ncbi:MAG: bi-domain-containing oxidoreductase [Saprospiraceae bacterium]|nr:bi-domain-containing oxidoreductase [Candidatus Vicinibacter affinis]